MTIPKGIDYGFTITVVEKDSFLPQDLQNMDLVNSSFKLCTLSGLCDVTTGTATLTRLADEATIYEETTDTLTMDYNVGDFINQTTSGLYYECITDTAAKKYLTDVDYFAKSLVPRYEETSAVTTRDYSVGTIIEETAGGIWYKCLQNTDAEKLLTDSAYFALPNAYSEISATITDDYIVNNLVENSTTGQWYRCIENAEVVSLTNTYYFTVTTPYQESSTTTTADYDVNNYIKDTGTGTWYRCISPSTTGALLTNLTYFEVVTLNVETNNITASAYTLHDLIYNSTYDTYYRCVAAVEASPLLTDVEYFTPFTLNTETSNTITSDYTVSDIVYNSTTNYYFRCTTAVTAQELLTNTNNFEVITVKDEVDSDNGIVNDYTVGEYAYAPTYDTLYVCIQTLTASELLTDTDNFTQITLEDITTYLDGKIKVVLDATMTDSLEYSRGDAVDGYYLKPTYQGVINIKFTDDTPERTAIIEKVYVAPTGVVCA